MQRSGSDPAREEPNDSYTLLVAGRSFFQFMDTEPDGEMIATFAGIDAEQEEDAAEVLAF